MSLLNSKLLKKLTLGLVGVVCYSALAVSNCSACDSSVDTDVLANEGVINIELTEAQKQLLQEQGKLSLEGINVEGVIENTNVINVVPSEASVATDVYFTDEPDTTVEYSIEEVAND